MSPNRQVAFRAVKTLGLAVVAAVLIYFFSTALSAINERNEQREQSRLVLMRVDTLAQRIDDCVSEEAHQRPDSCASRGDGQQGQAVAQLRLSIDCAALWTVGSRPEPCREVAERLDLLEQGINPFDTGGSK